MANEHLAYGIAGKKKADIKHLTERVQMALNRVAEHQAIVDSLQAKSSLFADSLTQATANKATALVNYNLVRDTVSGVRSLASNFDMARKQGDRASLGAARVSEKMSSLIGKLIFSVEVINKVTQLVNKQKALNAFLPDTLIVFMTNATKDANNAVALTLTALQSCYIAESTLLESNGVIGLANHQAENLSRRMLAGWSPSSDKGGNPAALDLSSNGDGLLVLLQNAYENSVDTYNSTLANNQNVADQVVYAQTELALANMQLSSLQAGLRAATAAAYAA
ncbi:hypothetical protein RYB01_03425 [Pseudomonas syringae]|nr:hypothetical protein [Pseudomonas syringae]